MSKSKPRLPGTPGGRARGVSIIGGAPKVAYGGRGLGIPQTFDSPAPDEAPEGYSAGRATNAELAEAGFDREGGDRKPGEAPLEELLVEGKQLITPELAEQILAAATWAVLRDSEGRIVATWDEGRWWTPEESRQFDAALEAALRAG